MTKFTIKKNVPLPKKQHRLNYPFSQMEVGDMFDVTKDDVSKVRTAASAENRYRLENKIKGKFVVRLKEQGSWGCWRIA